MDIRNLTKDWYQTISPEKHEIMLSYKTKIKGFIHYLFSVNNKEFRKYYSNFGKTRIKIFYYESLKIFKGYYFRYASQIFVKKNRCRFASISDFGPYCEL